MITFVKSDNINLADHQNEVHAKAFPVLRFGLS